MASRCGSCNAVGLVQARNLICRKWPISAHRGGLDRRPARPPRVAKVSHQAQPCAEVNAAHAANPCSGSVRPLRRSFSVAPTLVAAERLRGGEKRRAVRATKRWGNWSLDSRSRGVAAAVYEEERGDGIAPARVQHCKLPVVGHVLRVGKPRTPTHAAAHEREVKRDLVGPWHHVPSRPRA